MLERKKAELRHEIARRERELEKLEAMPDFSAMVDGTVAGMAVRLGSSRPYTYVGLKTGNRWYLTGETGPNGVSSDRLAEWLSTQGRKLVAFLPLAEIETQVEVIEVQVTEVEPINLEAALALAMSQAERGNQMNESQVSQIFHQRYGGLIRAERETGISRRVRGIDSDWRMDGSVEY